MNQHISIEPIGIHPIYKTEGYIIINQEPKNEIQVYEYFFNNIISDYNYGFNVKFITKDQLGYNSFVSIKNKLIKQISKLPNPATYLFTCNYLFPIEETFLPIALKKFQSNFA